MSVKIPSLDWFPSPNIQFEYLKKLSGSESSEKIRLSE